ncbi:MAG: excinuclease ABC subunit UvrA [Saprospiraceae bacterium]|nr:excinuclease ABC subunit UvrA [Saprospiraceae bacterium]
MPKSEQKFITIKGARANNLKNIDLDIPKNQLVVVTGVSGSGKSSITIDTLYAEGQRRYVESLSAYARQFLNRMKKPDVDFIKGICPAIAIEQKVATSNARSTVGSLTEIYDYLRLLYARIGKTYSPVSGQEVKKHQVSDVVDAIMTAEEGSRVILTAPFHPGYPDRTILQSIQILLQKGFSRIRYKGELLDIEDLIESNPKWIKQKVGKLKPGTATLLVDRFVTKADNTENKQRIADSVQVAFSEGGGECFINFEKHTLDFNNRFELDGITFLEPSPHLFNYNNPYGACPRCEGFGRIMGIDQNKVIPDSTKSVYEEAIQCWRGEKSRVYLQDLLTSAHHFDFPVHRAYQDLSQDQKDLLWDGNDYFHGINTYFERLEEKSYKIQNRVMLARYRGRTTCNVCKGSRLREETNYVKIGGLAIADLINKPLDDLLEFFQSLSLSDHDQQIAERIITEIVTRLENLCSLGLQYLHLDRLSGSLSGGETQRINLIKSIGSNLTDSLYILDEPSIGLHPRDTLKLINVLRNLRDLGNTVVVVEHEEDVIRSADFLVDMGPHAGRHGGEVIFAGKSDKIKGVDGSLTSDYLYDRKVIPIPTIRRKRANQILIRGAQSNNLDNITVSFQLNSLNVVSGVSGSGKSTLVHDILYQAMKRELDEPTRGSMGRFEAIEGELHMITSIELISQKPIGKSSRSNPVTYVKAYDSIRKLLANQPLSKIRGYQPKHFSFNVDAGRCENCKGDGETVVEMQFLADVRLQCEDCKGKKFKRDILEVHYEGKNIYDILELTIEEAIDFFVKQKDVVDRIQPLLDVGLGYVKLGQSSSTLSGGEAQRVKLASFLSQKNDDQHILFIFDEPTTGLHFHDINKLMSALNALVENGHTVVIVEHNLEVIKSADWLVELGPGGGRDGGKLLYQGDPDGLLKVPLSPTAPYLKEKLTSPSKAAV